MSYLHAGLHAQYPKANVLLALTLRGGDEPSLSILRDIRYWNVALDYDAKSSHGTAF